MSCDQSARKAGQAAQKSGVSQSGGQSSYAAGATRQLSFFRSKKKKTGQAKKSGPAGRQKSAAKTRSAQEATVAKSGNESVKAGDGAAQTGQSPQASFFDRSSGREETVPLPTQRQIKLTGEFTPEELQRLSIQLRLGAAAVARHIREVNSGAVRGLGHSDPRPLDWANLDLEQYQFLVNQLTEARRGRGYLDTSGLKSVQLVELWRFARFEAERAHRNIDHLSTPGSPITPVGGPTNNPTSEYLVSGHKLEARFYSFLAGQLEIIVPAEELGVEEI